MGNQYSNCVTRWVIGIVLFIWLGLLYALFTGYLSVRAEGNFESSLLLSFAIVISFLHLARLLIVEAKKVIER